MSERKTPEQVIAEALRSVTPKLHEPLYTQVLNEQAAHVAIELRAAGLLVGDPTEDAVERGARYLWSGDDVDDPSVIRVWEDKLDERDRERWREEAREFFAAAGVAPQDELPVASALPVGDDSGHAGDDDRGSREDGPEEEGCSHRTTVSGAPQEPAEASFTERRRLAEHAWAGYRAVAGGPESLPAWFGAGFTLGMNAERSRAGVAPQSETQTEEKSHSDLHSAHERARVGVHHSTGHVWVERGGSVIAQVYDRATAEEIVAALAAAPVVDEAKLAEVIEQARDRSRKERDVAKESLGQFIARALCEAAKRGELS